MTKPEYKLQVSVMNWLKLAHPKVLATISPSGMITSAGLAMKTKNMGYRSGTPDILIFEAKHGFHGLMIELKAETKPSENQLKFIADARERGYRAEVCYDIAQAKLVINSYVN